MDPTLGRMIRSPLSWLLPLCACVWLPASALAQGAPARPTITIERVETPPRLEDYVSGEVRKGTRVDGFLQRNPGDLTPVSEPTEAFLSYDARNLYAVFV